MMKSDKKVLIAKDVLVQLDQKRFVATVGEYFNVKKGKEFKAGQEFFTENLGLLQDEVVSPELLKNKVKKCEVCVRGALFVSQVERFNKKKVEDFRFRRDFPFESQTDIFSKQELLDIEMLFEVDNFTFFGSVFVASDFTQKLLSKVKVYSVKDCDQVIITFTTAEERMRAIMRSIIRNKGWVILADMKKAIVRVASAKV